MSTKAKTKSAAPKAKPARPMPKFAPAPTWIKDLFADLLSGFPETQPRTMFGYPAAFVNGNMACCVFGDHLMMRLSEADRTAFLKTKGAKMFEPMPGRPMKEYVEVPSETMKSKAELNKLVKKSVAFVQTMPPKVKGK